MRFSLASLQLHVPPECSQTEVFEPQFVPKNKHIQAFIAAAGHCGLGQPLLSYGIESNCHPGSWFFFFFDQSHQRPGDWRSFCARTVIKFWVSHVNAAFRHDFQETGTNCCSVFTKNGTSTCVTLERPFSFFSTSETTCDWWCRQHWLGCYPKFSKSM